MVSHPYGAPEPVRLPPEPGYNSGENWGQPCAQLGTAVDGWGMGTSCPRIGRSIHRSMDRAAHSPAPRTTSGNERCPHNPQPLLLSLPFSLVKKGTKQKQAEDEVGDKPVEGVGLSTKARGGRGDGIPGDGLTWMPAPGPFLRGADRTGGDLPRATHGQVPATLHEPRGSAVERKRA